MEIFFDVDFYIGLVAGGAIIWVWRAWVERQKAKVEAGIKKVKKKF